MKFPWSYTEGFVMGDLPMAPVSGLWTTPKLNTQQHAQVGVGSLEDEVGLSLLAQSEE